MKRAFISAAIVALLGLFAFVQGAGAAVRVGDGSFEAGRPNPYWQEQSTNGLPLIVSGAGAHTGNWYAYLGGYSGGGEVSKISQDIAFAKNGSATLNFYLRIAGYDPVGTDKFVVSMDGDKLLTIPESAGPGYPTYQLVSVDISAYLDGETHTLAFKGTDKGGAKTSWYLDTVVIPFYGVWNGSMEIDANGDNVPDGWKINSPSGDARRVCNMAITGSCSVRLPGSGAPETLSYTFKAANSGAAGDEFNFWCWIASENVPAASVGVTTTIFYTDGTTEEHYDNTYPAGTHGFALYGWTVAPSKPYKKIRLSFTYTAGTGRIWVDNVTLLLVGYAP